MGKEVTIHKGAKSRHSHIENKTLLTCKHLRIYFNPHNICQMIFFLEPNGVKITIIILQRRKNMWKVQGQTYMGSSTITNMKISKHKWEWLKYYATRKLRKQTKIISIWIYSITIVQQHEKTHKTNTTIVISIHICSITIIK